MGCTRAFCACSLPGAVLGAGEPIIAASPQPTGVITASSHCRVLELLTNLVIEAVLMRALRGTQVALLARSPLDGLGHAACGCDAAHGVHGRSAKTSWPSFRQMMSEARRCAESVTTEYAGRIQRTQRADTKHLRNEPEERLRRAATARIKLR